MASVAVWKAIAITVKLTEDELHELKVDLEFLVEDNRASETTRSLLRSLED